jgi:N-acetyl-gamma-glutamyl-phosphate reductase, uncommon form
MVYKVFVDGQEGTTGLKIHERLEKRTDIHMLCIDNDKRKDAAERKKLLNEADIAFLCLPDAAAMESVSLVENENTKIIDASTAHRTNSLWAYGLPELSTFHRDSIKTSKRVAVPGCYATGFNVAVYPLIKEGILPKDYPVTCHAVSGYSGGGKKLIEQYGNAGMDKKELDSPRMYAFGLKHKHLPEMQKVCGLDNVPLFAPMVADFYQGMTVAVPLLSRLMTKKLSAEEIQKFLAAYYKGQQFINVPEIDVNNYPGNGYLNATACNGTNRLELFVFGNANQVLLVSRLDNLGKGASGAAVQCMNIMLGVEEERGL